MFNFRMYTFMAFTLCVLICSAIIIRAQEPDIGVSDFNDFGLIDEDHDGTLDRSEFNWAYPESDVDGEFNKLDADHDGLIEVEELNHEYEAARARFKEACCSEKEISFYCKILEICSEDA